MFGKAQGRRRLAGVRMTGAGVLLATAFLVMAGSALASPTVLCVKNSANGAVKGPETAGGTTCKAGYNKVELPEGSELETLNKILPDIRYESTGVAGKPTIVFSKVNVEVNSGAGKTDAAVNGEGNLVIGYDENKEDKHKQEGSNNLILGEEQEFTSFAGIDAGSFNSITGAYASVTGGLGNAASSEGASVCGGLENTASYFEASVSGGTHNKAGSFVASVSGGDDNTAEGEQSAVSGGHSNKATGKESSISGGVNNTAEGPYSSVSAGLSNQATGEESSVSGGQNNTASGKYASIFGGKKLTAATEWGYEP